MWTYLIFIALAPAVQGSPHVMTCCCGILYGNTSLAFPSMITQCCGDQRYAPDLDTCCQGTLTRGIPEGTALCCGPQAYDSRYYTCCKDRLIPATETQDQCCFKTAFNQKYEICCGKSHPAKVSRRGRRTQCCGSTAFDARKGICCNMEVLPFSSFTNRCCGSVAYDIKKQVCCNGVLEDSPISLLGSAAQPGQASCGGYDFYIKTSACCCGTIQAGAVDRWTGCCGTQRFELKTGLCCNGVLHTCDPTQLQCCGTNVFDPYTQTCCGGKVFNKKGVCCGTTAVFNPKHEICCHEDVVFPGCPSRTKCCFDNDDVKPYDTKKQWCCDGVVHDKGMGRLCCGRDSYDPDLYMCCSGKQLISRAVFRESDICE